VRGGAGDPGSSRCGTIYGAIRVAARGVEPRTSVTQGLPAVEPGASSRGRTARRAHRLLAALRRADLPWMHRPAEVGAIGGEEVRSLVAEIGSGIQRHRRLAAVPTRVDRSARTRRSVADGIGDERNREAEGIGRLTLRKCGRPADGKEIAVAAADLGLAATGDTYFDARAVGVGRAAAGDRGLPARPVRRVTGGRVAGIRGTDHRRRLAASGRGVACRDRAPIRRDADLLLRLTGMGGEVARGNRALVGRRTVGVLVAASGDRRSRTLPARRANIRPGADTLVVAGGPRSGDVLAARRRVARVAGAGVAVVAIDRSGDAVAPVRLHVRNAGVGGAEIPVVAQRGAQVETGADEIAVCEVRGQRGRADGDRCRAGGGTPALSAARLPQRSRALP
jgi:hypothetical protein